MKDKRVDAYIDKAAPFAQEILIHLRKLVHKSCPEVEETIKWGYPNFDYKGSILCGMAAFKKHCAFTLWRGDEMNDPENVLEIIGKTSMGQLGKITSKKDLPANKFLVNFLKQGMKLNDAGKAKKKTPLAKKVIVVPLYLKKAFTKNKKAKATYDDFSYTNKKDYVEWLTDAKTEATREKRLKTAIEWMAEGKIRNWKYVKK